MEDAAKLNDGAQFAPMLNFNSSLRRLDSKPNNEYSQMDFSKMNYQSNDKIFTNNFNNVSGNIPITQNFFLKNKITNNLNIETEDSFTFSNKKKRRTEVEHYSSKNFKLNEIIVNGKYIKYLPDDLQENSYHESKKDKSSKSEDFSSSYINDFQNSAQSSSSDSETAIKIIKPIFEKNFKKLNLFSVGRPFKYPYNYYEHSKMSFSEFNHVPRPSTKELNYLNFNLNSIKFKNIFRKEFLKFEEDFYQDKIPNKITNDPKKLYYYMLNKLKICFNELQKDYISKIKKSVDSFLLFELERIIDNINRLYQFLLTTIRILQQKKKKIVYYFETYNCDICNKQFETGQGLGGHMSRMHPNQSQKYKMKMEIRNNRTEFREIIYRAKKQILSKDGFDYEKLKKSGDKKTINKIIKSNIYEYKEILRNLKKEKAESAREKVRELNKKISKNFKCYSKSLRKNFKKC
jgi:hypothetical protein